MVSADSVDGGHWTLRETVVVEENLGRSAAGAFRRMAGASETAGGAGQATAISVVSSWWTVVQTVTLEVKQTVGTAVAGCWTEGTSAAFAVTSQTLASYWESTSRTSLTARGSEEQEAGLAADADVG